MATMHGRVPDFLANMFLTHDESLLQQEYTNLSKLVLDRYGHNLPEDVLHFYRDGEGSVSRDMMHFLFLVACLFVPEFQTFVRKNHHGDADRFLHHLDDSYGQWLDGKPLDDRADLDLAPPLRYPNYTYFVGKMRTFYLGNILPLHAQLQQQASAA